MAIDERGQVMNGDQAMERMILEVMREYGGIPRIALRRLLCRTMEDVGAFERVLDRLVDDGRVSRLYVSTSDSIQSFVFPPVRKIWGMVDGKLTWYKR